MRLWSLHPAYLDTTGLIACWREGLLARKVLQGGTRGYRNHPQLQRFKMQPDTLQTLDQYLSALLEEALERNFSFDSTKIHISVPLPVIPVTDGQLGYELEHLKAKLVKRDIWRYEKLCQVTLPQANPIFKVIHGDVEAWEKLAEPM